MASISRNSKGACRLLFKSPDGKRECVRLGWLPAKAVKAIKPRLDAVIAAAATKTAIDEDTAAWLVGLDPKFYDKLSAAGLGPSRNAPEKAKLAAFIDAYLAKRTDLGWRTLDNLGRVRRNLINYFGAEKSLADITEGDADEWRVWLATEIKEGKKVVKRKLGENTIRRHCGRARQFFRAAVKRRLIPNNPFGEMMGITVQSNKERVYFVSREDSQKVIDSCPDAQWRLLFALSRFGGLRCHSEHLRLRWDGVDLAGGRMTVWSPKTERDDGKASRVIPIFPELRPYLEDAYALAEPGTEYVITRYRDDNQNLRTQLLRIMAKAGVKPYPKLFQNLRSTR